AIAPIVQIARIAQAVDDGAPPIHQDETVAPVQLRVGDRPFGKVAKLSLALISLSRTGVRPRCSRRIAALNACRHLPVVLIDIAIVHRDDDVPPIDAQGGSRYIDGLLMSHLADDGLDLLGGKVRSDSGQT